MRPEQVKLICSGALSLFGCFALFGIGFAALQAREAAVAVANDADRVTATVTHQVDALQQPIHESWELVRASRRMVDHVDKAAVDEQFYLERELPLSIAKLNDVLDTAQASIGSVQPVTAAATRGLQQLQPIEDNAAAVLHDADVLVRDPHVTDSLRNVDAGTAALSSAASHLEATSADTEAAVHHALHPFTRLARWVRHILRRL